MTNLFLMRHTQPVNGHPADGTRPLKPEGEQQAKDMGAWLAGHIGRVDIVICSPFVRAKQTADVMAAALGCHVADTRMLQPDGQPDEMWAEIMRLAQASKDVLVVGHDPSLNGLMAWLMYGDEEAKDELNPLNIRLEWGTVAWMKTKDDVGALQWLVTPQIALAFKDVVEAAQEFAASLG